MYAWWKFFKLQSCTCLRLASYFDNFVVPYRGARSGALEVEAAWQTEDTCQNTSPDCLTCLAPRHQRTCMPNDFQINAYVVAGGVDATQSNT